MLCCILLHAAGLENMPRKVDYWIDYDVYDQGYDYDYGYDDEVEQNGESFLPSQCLTEKQNR